MIRRSLLLLIMMGLTISSMAGCECLKHFRSSGDDAMKSAKAVDGANATGTETEPTKIQAVDADAKNPRPFFSNDRSPGLWSKEAREIEGHLGVGR